MSQGNAAAIPAARVRQPLTETWPSLVMAAILFACSAAGLAAALSTKVGGLSSPGPGWWPALAGTAGCILSFSLAGLIVLGRQRCPADPFAETSWGRVAVFTVAISAFLAVYPLTGFLLAAIPLAFVLLRFAAGAPWVSSGVTAVVVPMALYYLFAGYLRVSL
ncbi:tripartite tricarboxylate transporter TctB family protein [Sediminivirga luteola]|uniref:DUF1468 domain-containing protein n=1 Tax=Sediminivirga luteola TaxID=1774748 RepID=A0A8J2TZW1_9MICO|nr:tripartite tricarboxylate transporter TctB family protein [Sediminivirga luteola]MCI2265135.1 tripartite tricarboxylate transporter TctB family protein [Sediminivirga luteola]GGA22044.1 hypothetical protein GCM10011333_26350 [Sediminivirga luteola]